MNLLQSLHAPEDYCVTLNRTEAIDPARIVGRYSYEHPLFSFDAFRAQSRYAEIGGVNKTHFCGAYWGFGFHEDAVCSALRVARHFGLDLDACIAPSTKGKFGTAVLSPA
jgi:predicted NAD/FAD-binding protein